MAKILDLYRKAFVLKKSDVNNPSHGRLSTVGIKDWRRNLTSFSQVFTDAFWDKAALVTVVDNTNANPYGPITASTLTEAAGLGGHHIHELVGSFTPVLGSKYYMSIFIKQAVTAPHRYMQLTHWIAGFGALAYANIDLQTSTWGTIGSGIAEYGIADAGDGWKRYWIASTATATGASGVQLVFITSLIDGRVPSYTPSATLENVYIFGAQIDKAVLTTYQPQ
jgi:hypothetical protein